MLSSTDLQHNDQVHQTLAISTLELFISHQSELIWEHFHILQLCPHNDYLFSPA